MSCIFPFLIFFPLYPFKLLSCILHFVLFLYCLKILHSFYNIFFLHFFIFFLLHPFIFPLLYSSFLLSILFQVARFPWIPWWLFLYSIHLLSLFSMCLYLTLSLPLFSYFSSFIPHSLHLSSCQTAQCSRLSRLFVQLFETLHFYTSASDSLR